MLPQLDQLSPRQARANENNADYSDTAALLGANLGAKKRAGAVLPDTFSAHLTQNSNLDMIVEQGKIKGRNDGYSKFATDANNYNPNDLHQSNKYSKERTSLKQMKKQGGVRKAIDNLNSLNGKLANMCHNDDQRNRDQFGPNIGAVRSARVSMAQQSLTKVKKPMTLQSKDGGHLPLLKEPVTMKYASSKQDRYPQPSPEVKKVTKPTEAGYLNLRIKSSKAFPMSEVSAIEELIHKVRKMRDDTRQSLDPQQQNPQSALTIPDSGSSLKGRPSYDQVRTNNLTAHKTKHGGLQGSNVLGTQNDYLKIVQNSTNGSTVASYRGDYESINKKTLNAKPHSYEFLKQQMREIKKEVSKQRNLSRYNQSAMNDKTPGQVDDYNIANALSHVNSAELVKLEYRGGSMSPQLGVSNVVSPRVSNATRLQSLVPQSQAPQNISASQNPAFELRATSLPKISSKVKLSQFQVLDAKGQNSRAALHYKNLNKWDHQNLVDVKNYLEHRTITDDTPNPSGSPQKTGVFSPKNSRAGLGAHQPAVKQGLMRSKDGASNMASKKSLMNSLSNRSLFQTRQQATSNQASKMTLGPTNQTGSQASLSYISSNPYNNAMDQRDEIMAKKKSPKIGNKKNLLSTQNTNLEQMISRLPAEKQAYLTRLLEASNSQQSVGFASEMSIKPAYTTNVQTNSSPAKPQFRYHKHLATSRYEEFLAESDDEEFFKSKPKTKDGKSYQLDFKIDTFRDQIRVNKNGSQKTLLVASRPSRTDRTLVTNPSQHEIQFCTETEGERTVQVEMLPTNEQSLLNGGAPLDPELAAANEYLHSLGGMASIERYKQIEDMIQVPYYDQMGEVNKTVLHCADATFKIIYQDMNKLKVATMKQLKVANQAMVQRNTMPVFSGNIDCYLINQLAEFELLCKVKNVMSKEDTNRVHLSTVYPYYMRMMGQANTQFAEAAIQLQQKIKEKLAATTAVGGVNHPTTPMLELARTQHIDKPIDILRSKNHLQGVYFKKQEQQAGQKPCCRIHMDVFSVGSKFITYGGTAATVFNDIRSLDSVDFIWKVLKEDVEMHDFPGRFGHSGCAFERYLVIFGGCGPYSRKLKKRNSYQEIIVFDIETGKYVKFDGGPSSLQAEISELKTQRKNAQNIKKLAKSDSVGALDTLMKEQQTMKKRITTCSVVSMQSKPENDVWMALRKKAVAEMPEARAHHVGAVFGAGLFVHGGQSGEGSKTLADWNLFDFGLQVWINCSVEEVYPDESQSDFIHHRKYHSLTPVVESKLTNGRELTRLMWCNPLQELIRKPSVAEQGMYMFGGINEKGNQTDDLYWIVPDLKNNSKGLNKQNGEYKGISRPEVKLLAHRVKPEGRGPIARAQHSATFFKNQLVIFGGRNDAIFSTIKNVALNDLHIYDVRTNRWSAIAMYGDIPGSRWGHKLVANEDKIMLFGGMNLSSYCESVLYDLHIDDATVIDYLSKPIGLKDDQRQNSIKVVAEMPTQDDSKLTGDFTPKSRQRMNSHISRRKKTPDDIMAEITHLNNSGSKLVSQQAQDMLENDNSVKVVSTVPQVTAKFAKEDHETSRDPRSSHPRQEEVKTFQNADTHARLNIEEPAQMRVTDQTGTNRTGEMLQQLRDSVEEHTITLPTMLGSQVRPSEHKKSAHKRKQATERDQKEADLLSQSQVSNFDNSQMGIIGDQGVQISRDDFEKALVDTEQIELLGQGY